MLTKCSKHCLEQWHFVEYDQLLNWQVVGDPFGATTHSDLFIRARERGIQTKVVHNASILNAIGCCGLQVSST